MYNIIIPASGPGLRKSSNKPKIDVRYGNGQKLYERQVELLQSTFNISPSGDKCSITYILGFCADKVEGQLKDLGCNIVYNKNYNDNNVPFGIALGFSGPSLIIYGDIFFEDKALQYLPQQPSGSYLIKGSKGDFHPKNIGIGPNNVMDFCFEEKWGQIAYFHKEEAQLFQEQMKKPKNKRRFMFELVNEMTDCGCNFDVFAASGYLKEMDSIKDFNTINKWINKYEAKSID